MVESPKKLPARHAGLLLLPSEAAGGAGQGSRPLHPVTGVAQGLRSAGLGVDAALGGKRCLHFTRLQSSCLLCFHPLCFITQDKSWTFSPG